MDKATAPRAIAKRDLLSIGAVPHVLGESEAGKCLNGLQRERVVADALGRWLSRFAWRHFCSLTFAQPPSNAAASRHIRRWLRWLERSAQTRVEFFWVLEGVTHGRPHVHALLGGPPHLICDRVASAWRHGFTRVVRYRAGRGAAPYVVKCVGQAETEFDLSSKMPPLLSDNDSPARTDARHV